MALIGIIFKNDDKPATQDKPAELSKTGRVSSELGRMIYSFTLSDKVGILKDYGNEISIKGNSIPSERGITEVTFNKGAVSIYGGIGIVEQDTILEVPNVSNGSIGILVDLGAEAGKEMIFYAGDSPSPKRDNLQDNEKDGIYYFELYKYSVTGSQFSIISKTNQFIRPNSALASVLDGTTSVPKANQIVPSSVEDNSISFYVGSHLVKLEW